MDSENVLLTLAVIAVLFSVLGMTVIYNSLSNFQNLVSGYATARQENGTVIIEIQSVAQIDITHANGLSGNVLNWSNGTVEGDSAFLVTNGTVAGGTWSPINEGFRIRNVGNVKVNLSVHSNVSANDFIGGLGPRFEFNMTDYQNKSCITWSSGFNAGFYGFVLNETMINVCDEFNFASLNDTLRMDILLEIPQGAVPGEKVAEIILTYQQTA